MDNKLLDLHNKTSKLNSDEIILLICELSLQNKLTDMMQRIMKMYLVRALKREGFS